MLCGVWCVVCTALAKRRTDDDNNKKKRFLRTSVVRRVMWSDVDVSAQVIGQLLTLPVNAS